MNNACPKCGTAYGVSPAHVGRRFKCKKCGAALAVAETGLVVEGGSAAVPAAAARRKPAAEPAAEAGGSFDYEAEAAEGRDDYEDAGDRKSRSRARGAGKSPGISALFSFDRMVTPSVLRILYFIGVILIVLSGVAYLVLGLISGNTTAILLALVSALLGVPLSILVLRIYFELIYVIFSINDHLSDIKQGLRNRAP